MLAALLTALFFSSHAPVAERAVAPAVVQERPRLVVIVVVDQLASFLLDRYADVYTGGFRRLLDRGYRYTNAAHDHALTETAAGHATLSTGVWPSRHGVIANEWWQRRGQGWRFTYSVSDSASPIVGYPSAAGRSPANLARPGFADWLQSADGRSIVASVSRKDRSAITLAGQSRGHVYWIYPEEAQFVTSRYYRSEVPSWVARFNAGMPWSYGDTVWASTVPATLVMRARPDSSAYEADGVHTAFPHRVGELVSDTGRLGRNLWLVEVPFPDVATLAFVTLAVDSLGLGVDEHTDYLAVSFSQTDAVGHNYGPTSLEQLDNLLRLDRLLGTLLSLLDTRVGAGRWLLALSADHGVMPEPELLRDTGRPGRRFSFRELRAIVQAANDSAGAGDLATVRARAAQLLEQHDVIEDVIVEDELRATAAPADSFVALFRKSYYEGRYSGPLAGSGMWIRFAEGTLLDYATGSSHGTPYWYDRHVPLIFLGAGIEPGASAEPVRTVDLAPTLAALLGIAVPSVLDGRPLHLPRRPPSPSPSPSN